MMNRLPHKSQPVLVLGTTVEGNKSVTLTGADFAKHKHIIGVSGSGKSSFLACCALLLLKQGIPFLLIDPHGDLAKLILSLLTSSDFFKSPRAYDRLWYVDFARADAAIAFNVLKQEYESHTIASNLLEALHRSFPTSTTTASLDNVVLAATLVLVENGLPVTQLNRLLLDADWRTGLLKNVSDPLVIQFFKTKFEEKVNSQLIDSTLKRSFLLQFSPVLRNVLGQKQNRLNFPLLLRTQTSCIFDLGGLDEYSKRFIGSLLMINIEQAFLARAALPPEKRTPTHIIVDEFPLFSASEASFSIVLEQVRKYAGTLYLAHQTTSQLSKGITGSLQNAISILFKLGYEDSTWASQRFVRHEEQKQEGFFDLLLSGNVFAARQLSPFDDITTQQQAKQLFESLDRQEAIVTIGKQALRIKTPTLPTVTVDHKRLAAIEHTYARHLLTPLSQIKQEHIDANLSGVSGASSAQLPLAKRRVFASAADMMQPLQLVTGVLDTDILRCLYYFSYLTLSQAAKLLQKESSSNYLRSKVKSLIDDGLVETTPLARSSAGKPPLVYYLSAKGVKAVTGDMGGLASFAPSAKKHGYIEHSLACNEALIAAVLLAAVDPAITLVDLKHERMLKATPIAVGESRFVVPDGFVHLRLSPPLGKENEAVGICFEIDRNTEEKEKIQQKIHNYIAFAQRPYQQAFCIESLTIAFCVTDGGDRRVKQLVTWTEQVIHPKEAAALFVFSSVTPGAGEPTSFFFDRCFVSPFEKTPHALIEKLV